MPSSDVTLGLGRHAARQRHDWNDDTTRESLRTSCVEAWPSHAARSAGSCAQRSHTGTTMGRGMANGQRKKNRRSGTDRAPRREKRGCRRCRTEGLPGLEVLRCRGSRRAWRELQKREFKRWNPAVDIIPDSELSPDRCGVSVSKVCPVLLGCAGMESVVMDGSRGLPQQSLSGRQDRGQSAAYQVTRVMSDELTLFGPFASHVLSPPGAAAHMLTARCFRRSVLVATRASDGLPMVCRRAMAWGESIIWLFEFAFLPLMHAGCCINIFMQC